MIELGKHYKVRSTTIPAKVVADHGNGNYTVQARNLWNELVEWGETADRFEHETQPIEGKPLVPLGLVPPALAKCDIPLVLGCFVNWSELEQRWEIISARTGEKIFIDPQGRASYTPGIPAEQLNKAVTHARRCLDLVKAVV